MSKLPSQLIYEVIQGLSKAEKRYVKQELRRHVLGTVNQSELLFDELVSQTAYNEDQIKQTFSDYGFVQRLPKAKAELLDVVLRAMRNFHAKRGVVRRALTTMADVEFLRSRGHYAIAEYRLSVAIEEAELIEHDALQVLLISVYREVMRNAEKLPDSFSNPESDPLVVIAKKLEQSAFIEGLADRMEHLIARSGRSPSAATRALASELVKTGESAFPLVSVSAQNHWLRLLSKKALFLDADVESALAYDTSRLNVLKRNERYRRANIHQWVNLTGSVALRLILKGRLTEARVHRNNLVAYWEEHASGLSVHNKRNIGAIYVNIEIQLALQSLNFQPLYHNLAVLDDIIATLTTSRLLETAIACNFNIALVLFGMQKYRECVRRLHMIEDFPPHLRPEIHTAQRLLTILCHVEQGHESVVTSLVRSERRRYKAEPIPADVQAILALATKVFSVPPGTKLTKEYNSTLAVLSATDATFSEPITRLIDASAWVKARRTKKKWVDFVNQKNNSPAG